MYPARLNSCRGNKKDEIMNHDTYNLESCEDFYRDPEDEGYVHKDDLPDLNECKEALQDIASMLYSRDALDCAELDNLLSYIVYELRGKMPKGKININR